MEPRHRDIAKIALSVAGAHGFALAGGYAIREHGMGHRPSGDVDLFTDWHQRADFTAAVDAVAAALTHAGYAVTTMASGDTFARLIIASPGPDATEDKLEMAADWRAHPPVQLDVGPVLHPDDAVANKMCALYGRALPRDFLDIEAAVSTGRYTHERLLELAANADSGFTPALFADALGVLVQITDDAFDQYDVPDTEISALRHHFSEWRRALQS